METGEGHVRRTIEAVWRIESTKLIAGLARMVRDVGLAEELAQDAFLAAIEHWTTQGVPDKPGAWLMATAKRRAIDRLRQHQLHARKQQDIDHDEDWQPALAGADPEAAADDIIGDDVLRLVFTACHPVLSVEAQVALTLRLLGGLTTEEIARACLVPEATVAQRIVRAKRTLAEAKVPFETPGREELPQRLSAVLGVVYLIFNEGYAATSGEHWMRPTLCEEALRLGRILAAVDPDEADVHGLLALMELQASRLHARTQADGTPILLADQDRMRWDRLYIQRGLASLARAERLGGAGNPYALQAAIAACHARAPTSADTDWARIAALYDTLAQRMPSPVVELNRAVAYAMAFGPQAGLDLADTLVDAPALRDYHLLPSVRGDLLARLGRLREARVEFERAAGLARNEREARLLRERAAAIVD
ncbi:RNA polymerase sigma factor [Lysobacter sp. KIS68-7]|uniref:RNA polymerase sigma factor n=1 Tax=Lysobacter sp. KIS68-7 TaxID=2904252 RepID=UPI001E436B3F|nr:RNA polymerase sigma factor [Lysobacter sp. KIS68-7]UHQ19273.1 RNA polymerase sigma factor [Lysobacter sp. KIS68-7]